MRGDVQMVVLRLSPTELTCCSRSATWVAITRPVVTYWATRGTVRRRRRVAIPDNHRLHDVRPGTRPRISPSRGNDRGGRDTEQDGQDEQDEILILMSSKLELGASPLIRARA